MKYEVTVEDHFEMGALAQHHVLIAGNQDPNQSVILQLSVEVFYAAQNSEYSVRMSTLVDSTPQTNGASN